MRFPTSVCLKNSILKSKMEDSPFFFFEQFESIRTKIFQPLLQLLQPSPTASPRQKLLKLHQQHHPRNCIREQLSKQLITHVRNRQLLGQSNWWIGWCHNWKPTRNRQNKQSKKANLGCNWPPKTIKHAFPYCLTSKQPNEHFVIFSFIYGLEKILIITSM